MEIERLGNIFGEDKGTGYAGNVWNKSKLCPTLQTMQGGVQRANDYRRSKGIRIYG